MHNFEKTYYGCRFIPREARIDEDEWAVIDVSQLRRDHNATSDFLGQRRPSGFKAIMQRPWQGVQLILQPALTECLRGQCQGWLCRCAECIRPIGSRNFVSQNRVRPCDGWSGSRFQLNKVLEFHGTGRGPELSEAFGAEYHAVALARMDLDVVDKDRSDVVTVHFHENQIFVSLQRKTHNNKQYEDGVQICRMPVLCPNVPHFRNPLARQVFGFSWWC